MDNRSEDYKIIEQGLNSKNPEDKRQAQMAKERIGAESRETRQMRDELVKAHREGNKGVVEELHHKMKAENLEIKEKVERYYGR